MGFLLGAFGKLAAGRRVRQLQAQMMRVQSKLRRVTRQVDTTSKMLETQKKMALNSLSMQQYASNATIGSVDWLNANGMGDFAKFAEMGSNLGLTSGGLSATDQQDYAKYQTAVQQSKAQAEMMVAQEKQRIEEQFETMNDMMLEPLKMEEDSLSTEKDSLESQIQLAQADYDACKKMEQADAKNLAPNYTGQG